MSGYQTKKGLTSFQRSAMGTSPKLVWTCVILLKLVKQPFSAATQHLTQRFSYPSFSAPSFSSPSNCLQGQAHSHNTSWAPPATAPFHEMCNILALGANLGFTPGTWTFPDHPLAEAALWNSSAAWFCLRIKPPAVVMLFRLNSITTNELVPSMQPSSQNPAAGFSSTLLLPAGTMTLAGRNWGLLTLWCVQLSLVAMRTVHRRYLHINTCSNSLNRRLYDFYFHFATINVYKFLQLGQVFLHILFALLFLQ